MPDRRSPPQRVTLAALGLAAAALAWPGAAAALDGYAIVHPFSGESGPDGQAPSGDLVAAGAGYYFGASQNLGASVFRCECTLGGTVWKLTPKGLVTVLHSFTGTDGLMPTTGLVQGDDKLWYGTTAGGGAAGQGTAFRIDGSGGNFAVLHSLGATAGDGLQPWRSTLVKGPDGSFYGTTMKGGSAGLGTAFRLTTAGVLTVLHHFTGGARDGATPMGGLMLGSDGHLYGTTLCGGANDATSGCSGTAYRLTTTGTFTLLHSFDADPKRKVGALPQAALTEAGGLLYGTTTGGGQSGFGTLFRMGLNGSAFTTLHDFQGGAGAQPVNADGARPVARLLLAPDGALYGTTSEGGSGTRVYPRGDGTIFRVTQAGAYATLMSFGLVADDGAHPQSGLVADPDGVLHGLTEAGGVNLTGTAFQFPLPPL